MSTEGHSTDEKNGVHPCVGEPHVIMKEHETNEVDVPQTPVNGIVQSEIRLLQDEEDTAMIDEDSTTNDTHVMLSSTRRIRMSLLKLH